MRSELEAMVREFADCRICRELGVAEDRRRTDFSDLALRWLPERTRVLFLAESPPQPTKRGQEPFFFRKEEIPEDGRSTLFWALAEVLSLSSACGWPFEWAKSHRAEAKPRLLREFMSRGFWLVDAAKCAVNGLASQSRKNLALRRCCETWTRQEVRSLDPEGIVVIKTNVWRLAIPLLASWGLSDRILNDAPIPYPNNGHQGRFRRRMRTLVQRNPRLFA